VNRIRERAAPLGNGTACRSGKPGGISAGQRYRTSNPVTARPTIIRWISDVPSKIVKILAIRAVYAGQSVACGPHAISTDSARPVRDECRSRVGPCPVSVVVRTHAEKVLERLRGCCRQPTPQRVHPRYSLALTCEYLAVHDTGPRAARTGRTRAGRPEDAQTPGLAAVTPTRRRRGTDGPHHANDDKPALPRNT
jgi:hypothetical protein